MRIPIDRESRIPLYQQIITFLQEQISSGALPPGVRLPSSRQMSDDLGINRITVTNAYAELEAQGLITNQLGSGAYVAPPLPGLDYTNNHHPVRDWPLWQQSLLSRDWVPAARQLDRLQASLNPDDLISFASGVGETHLFPVDDFRKAVQLVLRRDGADNFSYGDKAGYEPLRKTIAQILTSQGIPANPNNILITSGSQQALALVGQLFLRSGDVILVESPTYSGAIDLFRSMDIRLLGIPVDDQGMQVDQVENALRSNSIKLIYTIPTFHNPTMACMNGYRRRQLVNLAYRFNVPILEDDYVGDLRYDGRALPALKALDSGGNVIYVSTFSKILMPGLRVGLIVADGPAYERLLSQKRVTDLATSNLVQRALQAYITVGRYQAHLRQACHVYGRRRDVMLEALKRYMPQGTEWQTPNGGMFIWLKLPGNLSANDLFFIAGEEKVTYTPGSFSYPGARIESYLRLNFAASSPEEIEEGIRRLGRAIERGLVELKEKPVTEKVLQPMG